MINIAENPSKHVVGETSLYLTFDFNPQIIASLKSCETSYYDKKIQTWEVPLTNLSKLLDELILIDDINLTLKPYKEQEYIKYTLNKHKANLFKHQEEAVEFGLNHNSWLLLDEMGLGKTLSLITLAEELQQREHIEHCLIICGINTLKHNWLNEIGKFSNLSATILGTHLSKKNHLVEGTVVQRLEHLKKPIKEFFVITNIETIRNKAIVKELNNGVNNFEMIALDEAHVCKDPTSAQGAGFLKLTKAKYKVAMTGSLLMNDPCDAYVPLKWIGAVNCSYSNFKYYYCTYGGNFKNVLMGFKNMDVLKDTLSKVALRRTKDILNLPEKNIIHEFVDMSPAQATFYDNIVQGLVQQVDRVHINTSTLLSMITRLRQATACPSILTSENIPSAKIERVIDMISQVTSTNDKIVVFSTFKDTLKEIAKRLPENSYFICTGDCADSEISSSIEQFQKDDTHKVMLASWQKMGTGVTLTRASYAVFIDCPWTSAQCSQAEDRIHRIGTKKPVFIYYLWNTGTIDERVKEIVEDKGAISAYVVDNELPPHAVSILRKYIQDLQIDN